MVKSRNYQLIYRLTVQKELLLGGTLRRFMRMSAGGQQFQQERAFSGSINPSLRFSVPVVPVLERLPEAEDLGPAQSAEHDHERMNSRRLPKVRKTCGAKDHLGDLFGSEQFDMTVRPRTGGKISAECSRARPRFRRAPL
jgi:hypothetical protein